MRQYGNMTNSVILTSALRDATDALWAVSETPRLDAELIAAYALQMGRSDMLMRLYDLSEPAGYKALINRRADHEPVAYIIGTQAFWDIELIVTPDVLIPRSDSEALIEAAQRAFARTEGPNRILDLGTGSGALLLAALSLFPGARGIGVDASAAALDVARGNAHKLGFGTRADMRVLNWHDAGWTSGLGMFDLILCNPPYVETTAELAPMVSKYEPHCALFAGEEGLDDYMVLLPQICEILSSDGVAIFEIGYNQADAVSAIAANAGLRNELRHDLSRNPRCLTIRAG